MTGPDTPRLLDGLALIPVEDGYLADGGPRRQLLSGRVARELFPRLLPLLDGAHPVTEIAATLGEPAHRIQRILDLLRQRDLLDQGPPLSGGRPDPMRTYLRRRLPHIADLVGSRLAAARVLVLGPDRLCGPLTDLLRASGVGAVTRQPATDGATPVALIIQVRQAPAVPVEPGDQHDVPRLVVSQHDGTAYIGPLLHVADSACPLCTDGDLPADSWQSATGALIGAATALAAAAALRFLGQGTTRLARRVVELSDPGTPQRERVVVPRPDCPACGQPGAALDGPALAEFADEHGAEPPLLSWDPEPAPRTERTDPAPRKQYVSPAGVPGRCTSEASAVVAWLLAHTVGEIPASAAAGTDRWVPSAAAPGSTRAYVLGNLTARAPVIHYFDAPLNEFVPLPGPLPAVPTTATTSAPEQDRFVVVLTGDSAVAGPTLGPAARRALRQDAGLCLAQIAVYAKALGWRVSAADDATGAVAAALELDQTREFVTAVMELVPRSPGSSASVTASARRLPGRLRRRPLAYRFDDSPVPAGRVTEVAVEALRHSEETWNAPDAPSCVLYARRLHGLAPGLYEVAAHRPPQPLAARSTAPIEAYLGDRTLDPAAMLFFTGHLAGTLSSHGAPGYPRLLTRAASAAGLVRLATAGDSPMVAGLIAGFPPSLLSASIAENDARHRVFYACALGNQATGSAPDAAIVAW